MRLSDRINTLPSPVVGADVEPKENPDVCPAGLKDVLNNEEPGF